jgi:hypothetical protein
MKGDALTDSYRKTSLAELFMGCGSSQTDFASIQKISVVANSASAGGIS